MKKKTIMTITTKNFLHRKTRIRIPLTLCSEAIQAYRKWCEIFDVLKVKRKPSYKVGEIKIF